MVFHRAFEDRKTLREYIMRIELHLYRQGRKWIANVSDLSLYFEAFSKKQLFGRISETVERCLATPGVTINVHAVDDLTCEIECSDEGALIAYYLRSKRRERGLSLAHMAKRLHLNSRSVYYKYENGQAVPSVKQFSRFLRALDPDTRLIVRSKR